MGPRVARRQAAGGAVFRPTERIRRAELLDAGHGLRRWHEPPPSATSPARWTLTVLRRTHRLVGAALREHGDPVFDRFGCVAVNFQPRERLSKDRPVGQRPLRADACRDIAEASLQPEDLSKSFQIAAGQRQAA